MELRRAALALLGGVALVASSCSSTPPAIDSPTTQLPAAANPVFAKGGAVTVAVPYLPTNFNPSTPAGANRVTQMVMEQVWPQAFVTDAAFQPGTTGFIDGAEVVGLHPMKVSYQIDPKATWSDGYPITAADFVYNWHNSCVSRRSFRSPVTWPVIATSLDFCQQRRQERDSRIQDPVLGLGGVVREPHSCPHR